MARYAALLRGVNVGPTTRVPMAELKALLEELGATDVKTHLNSGNATFELHASPKTINEHLSVPISERFGFDIPVVARTKKQLESVLAENPFGDAVTDESKYIVVFMPDRPKAAAIKQVTEAEYPNGELCWLRSRELYVWSPRGVSESQSIKALEKAKAVDYYTARNAKTIRKLIDAL
jgi:uncharacterized protein (DUF1697 family)